ncbi:hypothetical protein TNCV_3965761 [Trichonephila clavipes]|nr:hypothetical protein TNCV_3965761 [Trichonephila clavipes]
MLLPFLAFRKVQIQVEVLRLLLNRSASCSLVLNEIMTGNLNHGTARLQQTCHVERKIDTYWFYPKYLLMKHSRQENQELTALSRALGSFIAQWNILEHRSSKVKSHLEGIRN